MSGMASVDLTGRVDAITYQSRGHETFYVSEYASSAVRGRQLDTSLRNLVRQIRKDVGFGLYSLPRFKLTRTFVTLNSVTLQLRDGVRSQWFPCRIDEVEDSLGRHRFEASCPTNYLRESGKTIQEALDRLSEVIKSRYAGEGIHDLMREMPKCPIMTTVDISVDQRIRWGTAVITRSDRGYQAVILGPSFTAQGNTPDLALKHAEEGVASLSFPDDSTSQGEPAFCTVDVSLPLHEGTSVHRFLVTISSNTVNGSSFFYANAPQAGDITVKSQTFDEALAGIRDAIALEFREKEQAEVQELLKMQFFLATARLPVS